MALRSLSDHPKFAELKAILRCPKWQVMGCLECIWHFAGKYTPQGNIGKYSDQAIEAWCEWDGEPGTLTAALIESRWLDKNSVHRLVVHDWHEHADDLVNAQLARQQQCFWNGAIPNARRLNRDERKRYKAWVASLQKVCGVSADGLQESCRVAAVAKPMPKPSQERERTLVSTEVRTRDDSGSLSFSPPEEVLARPKPPGKAEAVTEEVRAQTVGSFASAGTGNGTEQLVTIRLRLGPFVAYENCVDVKLTEPMQLTTMSTQDCPKSSHVALPSQTERACVVPEDGCDSLSLREEVFKRRKPVTTDYDASQLADRQPVNTLQPVIREIPLKPPAKAESVAEGFVPLAATGTNGRSVPFPSPPGQAGSNPARAPVEPDPGPQFLDWCEELYLRHPPQARKLKNLVFQVLRERFQHPEVRASCDRNHQLWLPYWEAHPDRVPWLINGEGGGFLGDDETWRHPPPNEKKVGRNGRSREPEIDPETGSSSKWEPVARPW
jgi:hypothetical protein